MKSKYTSIQIKTEVKRRLDEFCLNNGYKISGYVESLLEASMAGYDLMTGSVQNAGSWSNNQVASASIPIYFGVVNNNYPSSSLSTTHGEV